MHYPFLPIASLVADLTGQREGDDVKRAGAGPLRPRSSDHRSPQIRYAAALSFRSPRPNRPSPFGSRKTICWLSSSFGQTIRRLANVNTGPSRRQDFPSRWDSDGEISQHQFAFVLCRHLFVRRHQNDVVERFASGAHEAPVLQDIAVHDDGLTGASGALHSDGAQRARGRRAIRHWKQSQL